MTKIGFNFTDVELRDNWLQNEQCPLIFWEQIEMSIKDIASKLGKIADLTIYYTYVQLI